MYRSFTSSNASTICQSVSESNFCAFFGTNAITDCAADYHTNEFTISTAFGVTDNSTVSLSDIFAFCSSVLITVTFPHKYSNLQSNDCTDCASYFTAYCVSIFRSNRAPE